MAKSKRPKRVNYELIADRQSEPWRLLRELIAAHHDHLTDARFAMAWRKALKKDADGLLVLGKCKKASDLDRELKEFDFVILLNREAWDDLDGVQRRALVDHELSHAEVARDEDDRPKKDERGRTVYRVRKHDIEEFKCVVERHGLYKSDLEAFVRACRERRKSPLFPPEEGKKKTG